VQPGVEAHDKRYIELRNLLIDSVDTILRSCSNLDGVTYPVVVKPCPLQAGIVAVFIHRYSMLIAYSYISQIEGRYCSFFS